MNFRRADLSPELMAQTSRLGSLRKPLLFFLCLCGFASAGQAQAQYSDNVDIDAGELYTASGADMPIGGLLQLIASPVDVSSSGVFTPPTSASFVTGGDILVESFSMNYSNSPGGNSEPEAGEDAIFAVGGTSTIQSGYALQLRWFPGLTLSSTSPGVGATYGTYRSNSPENRSGKTAVGIAWFVPGVGETITTPNGYNFLTATAGGTNPDTLGNANLTVIPVPEPSSGGWLVGAALCVTGWWARKPVGVEYRRRRQMSGRPVALWSIFRSPLIFGGDLTNLDAPTLSLLSNAEVIRVDRDSSAIASFSEAIACRALSLQRLPR